MRIDKCLRLSTFMTVALAGAALTYAEEPYFPGFIFVAAGLAILLLIAYFVEGSWWLSTPSANALGIIISLGWIGWIIFFSTEFDDPINRPLWPAMFLPYFGPLLMVLVLVKLFRPKGIRDYWNLQIICLIEVAIGSVLVVEAEFSLWLIGYFVCAFWSMAVLYLHRTSLGTTANSSERIPWRHGGIWKAGRWTAVVAFLALLMFLLTPQHGTTEAISEMRSRATQAQTGFSDTIMDLNATGRVEIDESVAFEVYVENADRSPKTDLNPDIRWRGRVLDRYSKGRWGIEEEYQRTLRYYRKQQELPRLGPDQFFITFFINTAQSHGLFLAEPVIVDVKQAQQFRPETIEPYVSRTYEGNPRLDIGLFEPVAGKDTLAGVVNRIQVSYQQVTLPQPADGMSHRSPISPEKRSPGQIETRLTSDLLEQPVAGIRDFTLELLDQMVKDGKLTENDLRKPEPPSKSLLRANRAKVARALSNYLAFSGEYSYSLNLTRQDKNLDPAEDYLRNVKEGHCERVATALVLMLRSAGIPSRLVVGFRGADSKNSIENYDGWYVIRQSHAHTWVEALVGVETPDRKIELHWLTLDPSPQFDSVDRSAFSWSSWSENVLLQLRTFWRVYVLEYNAGKQGEAIAAIWTQSGLAALAGSLQREPYWLVGPVVIVAGLVWLRPIFKRRRGGRVIDTETAFYHRLLGLLAKTCRLTPKIGQTPMEFGETVQDFLIHQNLEADLARIPNHVIQFFYQVRYGRLPLNPTECEEIDRQLHHLGDTLKKIPRLAN